MERRIYHGTLNPEDLARALIAHFNRANLVAQKMASGEKVMVQITTRERPASGGQTALTVTLHGVEDSLAVQVSKQAWLGVAASLGVTALAALRNPYSLLSRLDDLAQDIENLSLREEIWEVVDNVARLRGATLALSDRLRRMVCEYCETANPVGEPSCIACGAPLGDIQPSTCPSCGFVVKSNEKICPNCSQAL